MVGYLLVNLPQNGLIQIRRRQADLENLDLCHGSPGGKVHCGGCYLVAPPDHPDLLHKNAFQYR